MAIADRDVRRSGSSTVSASAWAVVLAGPLLFVEFRRNGYDLLPTVLAFAVMTAAIVRLLRLRPPPEVLRVVRFAAITLAVTTAFIVTVLLMWSGPGAGWSPRAAATYPSSASGTATAIAVVVVGVALQAASAFALVAAFLAVARWFGAQRSVRRLHVSRLLVLTVLVPVHLAFVGYCFGRGDVFRVVFSEPGIHVVALATALAVLHIAMALVGTANEVQAWRRGAPPQALEAAALEHEADRDGWGGGPA